MGKFALVFPGQGSQKLGMLNGLAAEFPVVAETFREASALLDQDLWEIAQHSSNHRLMNRAMDKVITPEMAAVTRPVFLEKNPRSGMKI